MTTPPDHARHYPRPYPQVPRQPLAREVRMRPKVVFWVVFSVSLMAIASFSMMFVMAAYRNNWW